MENIELYKEAFVESLEIDESILKDLEYQGVDTWDSVGHMVLMASLEEKFDIMLEMDDIIDFSSFEKGKSILAKYDVVL
tara:strand:- start:552 stop:788 length:237 start_codon:yes stop_codon:yes gene_type:complete